MASIKEVPVEARFEKEARYFASSRDDVLALLPAGTKKILDVGCGSAQTWAGKSNFEVWGVERNESAAAIARKHLKKVFSSDLESALPDLQNETFDIIFLADVIEHLYDPWGMLMQLNSLLGRNGRVLISVPNFGNYRVLKRIIFRKEFRYSQEGILDVDHIRFFCRRDVEWMLKVSGYKIEKFTRKYSGSKILRALNVLLFGALNDLLAEQFIILARKA